MTAATPTTLFEKTYDGESIVDAYRDFSEALTADFNDKIHTLPTDNNGFCKGTFTVKIEWHPEGGIQ